MSERPYKRRSFLTYSIPRVTNLYHSPLMEYYHKMMAATTDKQYDSCSTISDNLAVLFKHTINSI